MRSYSIGLSVSFLFRNELNYKRRQSALFANFKVKFKCKLSNLATLEEIIFN
jgi:hypothetical protein